MIVSKKIEFFSDSLIGPRRNNEDYLRVEIINEKFVATVADGVGGRNCGANASQFSVNLYHNMIRNLQEAYSDKLINDVNAKLLEESKRTHNCEGMATTFTSCTIDNFLLKGVHVGDTRLCLLRENGIKELTYEHSEAARLYREKLITGTQYINYPRRNIIESALGITNELKKQIFYIDLKPKDRLILSSDGFHNLFTKEELRNFSVKSSTLSILNETIHYELNIRQLKDNCTYVIFEIPFLPRN